jgi:putative isomerase
MLFYDQDSGYFYDRAILSKSRIKVAGPEGWIPLYTGVATPEQAEGVLQRMMDPTYFKYDDSTADIGSQQ